VIGSVWGYRDLNFNVGEFEKANIRLLIPLS